MSTRLEQLPQTPTGHSATIDMWLHVGPRRIPLLQACDTAVKIGTSEPISPGDAVVEIIVDGRSHRHEVRVLPERPRANWIAIADR